MPGSSHSKPNCGHNTAGQRCLRSLHSSTFDSMGKNERQDAIKPECFLGAGEIFIGGNIYGRFRRHLLTLNKSLELEMDTDAKRIKSKK